MTLCTLFNQTVALNSCSSPIYPAGTAGGTDDIQYNAMAISATTSLIAVGGKCKKNSNICDSTKDSSLVEMLDPSTTIFTWSKYVVQSSTITNADVNAIAFNYNEQSVAVALDVNAQGLSIIILKVSDGSLIQSIIDSSTTKATINTQGILIDNSNNIFIGYQNVQDNPPTLYIMMIPPLTTTSVSSAGLLKSTNILTSGGNHEQAIIDSFIFDNPSNPQGIYLANFFNPDDTNWGGLQYSFISIAGQWKWDLVPNIPNAAIISYMSINGNSLWSCGSTNRFGSPNAAIFAVLTVSGATPPTASNLITSASSNSVMCLAIEGSSSTNAVALIYNTGGGINSYSIDIASIYLQPMGGSVIYRYTGLSSDFDHANLQLTVAAIQNGYIYFAGGLNKVTQMSTPILSNLAGFVMKMTATAGATFSDSCQSYTLTYSTSNIATPSFLSGTSIVTTTRFIAPSSQITYSQISGFTVSNIKTTGLIRLQDQATCYPLPSLQNQNYDIGTSAGTSSYIVTDYSTTVCSGSTFTYTITITPGNNPITFTPSSAAPFTFDWSTATKAGTYTIEVQGALSATRLSTPSFTVTITDSCNNANIVGGSQVTLTYAIGSSTAATSPITFLVTPSSCVLVYSLAFNNGTAITQPNIFSLSSSTPPVFTVGPSTNNALSSTYSVNVIAYNTDLSHYSTQTFAVTVQDQCYSATILANTGNTYSYEVLDSQATYTLNAFTIVQNVGAGCYSFTLYNTDNSTTTLNPPLPSWITFNYPTLQIGVAPAGAIGTLASMTYSYSIKAYNGYISPTTTQFSLLTITVTNECTSTSVVSNPTGDSYSYTIAGGTISQTLTSFSTLTQKAGANCFQFQVVGPDQSTPVSPLPSYISFTSYPTITFGPSSAGDISTTPSITDSWFVKCSINMIGGPTYTSPLNIMIYNECYLASITATGTGDTYVYTLMNPLQTHILTAFTLANYHTIVGCFTFNLLLASDLSAVVFPSYIFYNNVRSVTIGSLSQGQIGLTPFITYNWVIQGYKTISGVGSAQTVPVTITVYNECYPATVSAKGAATTTFSYTIAQPSTVATLGLFNYAGYQTGSNCYGNNLVDTATGLAIAFPTYISYNAPLQLTLGPSSPRAIGSQAQIVYSWTQSAYKLIDVAGTTVSVAITITILNECTGVVLSSSTTPTTYSYIFYDSIQSDTLASFTFTPTSQLSCINIAIFETDQVTVPTLPPYISYSNAGYPALSIFSSLPQVLSVKSQVYSYYISGQVAITGMPIYFASLTITIYHQCYFQSVVAPSIGSPLTYYVGAPSLITAIPPFAITLCQIQYVLMYSNSSIVLPSDPIFQFNSGLTPMPFSVLQQTQYTLAGSYQLDIQGTVVMGIYQASLPITINIVCNIIGLSPNSNDVSSPGAMQNITYTILQGPMVIPIHEFVPQRECGIPISYKFTLIGNFPLPSFMTTQVISNKGGSLLTISLDTRKHLFGVTSYTVILTGTSKRQNPSDGQSIITTLIIPVQIIIPNKGPPFFMSAIHDITIKVGTKYDLTLPGISDPDPDDTGKIFNIIWGNAGNFTTGSSPNFAIAPQSNSTDIGTSIVTIQLKDDNPNPLFANVTFKITVQSLGSLSSSSASQNTQGKPNVLPVIAATHNITALISSISLQGLVTVQFSVPIKPVANYSENINASALQIKVVPGKHSQSKMLGISNWTLTSFKSTGIQIQLMFENPLYISQYQLDMDTLDIKFIINDFFLDASSGTPIIKNTVIAKPIPKQLSNDASSAMLASSSGPATSTMTSMMYGNLAMNLVMSASLQMLWGMINVMQLIVHMPLLNLQFPQNAAMFYGFLNNMASFNLIPTDQLNAITFTFTETNQPNQNFQSMSYNSDNIIDNLGSMFEYSVGYIPLCIFTLLLKKIKDKNKYLFMLYSYLSNLLFYNFILRTFLEGYIEFAIDDLINLGDFEWKTWSDYVGSICTMLFSVIVFGLPILVWVLLWKRFNSLEKEDDQKKFGSIYAELRVDSKAALLYHVIYMMRRLIFASISLYLINYPGLQVQLVVLHCICVISYIGYYRPFEIPMMNKLEVFNEVCILISAYHLFYFTDYTPDPIFQYQVGWSILSVTSLNIAMNMLVMFTTSIRKLRLQLRLYKLKFDRWSENQKQAKKLPIQNNFDMSSLQPLQVSQAISIFQAPDRSDTLNHISIANTPEKIPSIRTVKKNKKKDRKKKVDPGVGFNSKPIKQRAKRVSTLDELRRDYNQGIHEFKDEEDYNQYYVKRHAALMQVQQANNFIGRREDGSPCNYIEEEDRKQYEQNIDHDLVVNIGGSSNAQVAPKYDIEQSPEHSFAATQSLNQSSLPRTRTVSDIEQSFPFAQQQIPIVTDIQLMAECEKEPEEVVKRDVGRILSLLGVNQDGSSITRASQQNANQPQTPLERMQSQAKIDTDDAEINIYIDEKQSKKMMAGAKKKKSIR